LPIATWLVTPKWLPAGSAIEMLTPRDDTKSPSLFITPKALTNATEQEARASRFHHSIGVHRVTAIRLISPKTYQPIDSLTYLQKLRVLRLQRGDEWLVELTFDRGKLHRSKNFEPELPLVVHY